MSESQVPSFILYLLGRFTGVQGRCQSMVTHAITGGPVERLTHSWYRPPSPSGRRRSTCHVTADRCVPISGTTLPSTHITHELFQSTMWHWLGGCESVDTDHGQSSRTFFDVSCQACWHHPTGTPPEPACARLRVLQCTPAHRRCLTHSSNRILSWHFTYFSPSLMVQIQT